jgi:hypothetical protein
MMDSGSLRRSLHFAGRRAATVLAILVPASGAAQSQDGPVEPTTRALRSGAAIRVDTGPTVDGLLDEAAWASARPMTDFVQYEPVEGAAASEKTEVRILFDEDAIYVGAWLYDREPEGIIVGERRRDTNLGDADGFMVVFDTYHDQQSGFVFGTNPGSIEYDAQVRGESGANTNWDGSWTVATTQSDEGWFAEMRIPFSTLRHASGDEQLWGLNITRYIRRKNEQVVWSPVPRQWGFFRLTEAGVLSGLQPPARRVATVTPYALSAAQRVPRLDANTTYPFEAGGDAKIGITQSLALDLTLNTDFAQVEADAQQVDLTRFSLFFPEKRPFFLENADLFSVGLGFLPGRTSGRTALFHSRRIGVASGGEVPIDFGGRVSGRAGGFDVGLLHMQTEGLATVQESTGWSVARVARELPNRSRVGGIFTSRVSRDTPGAFNRTYGVDGRLGIGETWTFNGLAGVTDEPGVEGGEEILNFLTEYQTPNWYFRGYYDQLGDNFNPAMGFIPFRGFREGSLRLERTHRPAISWLREIRTHLRRTWAHDFDGFKLVDFRHIHSSFIFENGSQFSPAFQRIYDGLTVPFAIRGTDIVVPAGQYSGWASYGNLRTNTSAPVSLNGRFDLGSYLSGNRWGGSLGVNLRQGDTFTGGVTVAHNRIRLPQGNYNTTLTRLNLQYAFSPSIFLQSQIQHTDQTGIWSGNLRLGWLTTAGTGLYLVYNERQEMDIDGVSGLYPRRALEPAERIFVIKFTRQFDISGMTDHFWD